MKIVIDIPQGMIDAFSHEEQWTAVLCKDMNDVLQNGTPYEERPRGKWELLEKRPYQNLYMCSKCGHIIESMPDRLAENFKGCYCGADMRGEEQ